MDFTVTATRQFLPNIHIAFKVKTFWVRKKGVQQMRTTLIQANKLLDMEQSQNAISQK
jgi:hypothetical protein